MGFSSTVIRLRFAMTFRGSRTSTSEARLFDEHGKLLEHGIETCIIFPAQITA
jgi:hypothetical protein